VNASKRWFVVVAALAASGCVLPKIDRWVEDGSPMPDAVIADRSVAPDVPLDAPGAIDVVEPDSTVASDVLDTGVSTDDVAPVDVMVVDTGVCAPGQVRCGGSCVSTQSDPTNCGTCGMRCPMAMPMCSAGTCRSNCGAGETSCGAGVCANLQTNVNHCGMCARACTAPSGGIVCSMGSCGISGCPGGIADCDGMFANGCEVNTNTDANNCGMCGVRCPAPIGGTAVCTSGRCMPQCPPGVGLVGSTCVSACGAVTRCSGGECPPALCGTALFAVPWSSLGSCGMPSYGMASPDMIRDCTNAARAACMARGYTRGGWGPIEANSVTATVVCESAVYTAAPTTGTMVSALMDGARRCGPTSQWSNQCTAAIVDACMGQGGFGAIDLIGSGTVAGVCYPPARTTQLTIANDMLPGTCSMGMTSDVARRSNACLNSLAMVCRTMVPGSIAGAGPVHSEDDPGFSFVWCIRPTL